MSFSITEDMKKELRDECMKEAYKYFKLTKTISDHRYYFYLSSQNLKGSVLGGNNNSLFFRFPSELQNHITDGRIKVLDCKLPQSHNADVREAPKWYIALQGGVLKKNNYVICETLASGNDTRYEDIIASGIREDIVSEDRTHEDPRQENNTIIITQDGGRLLSRAAGNPLDANAPANTAVGGYQAKNITGFKLDLDGEFRACRNPAGKECKIIFYKENIANAGIYDLTKAGGDEDTDWTMTLMLELLPDFNRNDKIMF